MKQFLRKSFEDYVEGIICYKKALLVKTQHLQFLDIKFILDQFIQTMPFTFDYFDSYNKLYDTKLNYHYMNDYIINIK
jgi:hypothetical protein